jgi:hypothetical protein
MVIDKWTRTQNNKSLSIPLLGHKTKDNFYELKKEYERLQNLNRKFNKKSKDSPQNAPDSLQKMQEIDQIGIKEYINQISSIFLSINEIISENNNYETEEINTSVLKEINLIADKILSEYNIFLNNIKELENFENIYDFNYDLNLLSREIKNVIKNIKKKLKKDENEENEENNAIVQPQNRTYNFDRNIDRGHINILTYKREYNDSVTVLKDSFHYSVEIDRPSNSIKLYLFLMLLFFVLFICYMCIF